MNGREYLEQIKKLDDKINNKINEKAELFTLATHITPTLSDMKVQTSHEQDKMGDVVAKIVMIEEEINNCIDEFVDLKTKIIKQIEALSDHRYYSLLYKKYVQYKRLYVIAEEMNYTYDYVRVLHIEALNEFEITHGITQSNYVMMYE